ncbi:3'-5' exoribonuclease [Streptomyces sp. 891-h]|uniref:3'-5' exoribonuclease domain-containing protein n=1 Tax=Streptomyces sp. 891-h TaxID=2720714 RepID=UPI001FAAE334|nr:3'-5' exoribonuclease [Streptomyces sp. 891-h]UNZ20636.1 3'-5' exoribonuclease [Streptomyces sp. 891-h]
MTAIDYDLEFLEDGRTIELISIGMVCDDDREYYAVNSDAPWDRIRKNDWLIRNVLPSLPITGRTSIDSYLKVPANSYPKPPLDMVGADTKDIQVKPHWAIANEVRDFIQAAGPDVELWANYGAYDHVCLAQLWGRMIDLPSGVPMFTNDIQQEARRLGFGWDELPQQESGEHNALADARHNQIVRRWLAGHA